MVNYRSELGADFPFPTFYTSRQLDEAILTPKSVAKTLGIIDKGTYSIANR
jgi:hypothetical protein